MGIKQSCCWHIALDTLVRDIYLFIYFLSHVQRLRPLSYCASLLSYIKQLAAQRPLANLKVYHGNDNQTNVCFSTKVFFRRQPFFEDEKS